MRYESVRWEDYLPIRIGWATTALLGFKSVMLEELQHDIAWDVLLQATEFKMRDGVQVVRINLAAFQGVPWHN
eukprot:11824410-Karenia_brevis.AAC.1